MFYPTPIRRRPALAVGLALLLVSGGQAQQEETATTPHQALEEALGELRAGRFEIAQSRLEEVCKRWPNFRLASYHLGRLAFERGHLQLAAEQLQLATDGNHPRLFSAWYYLGRLQSLERGFAAAISSFDRSLELAPGFVPSRLERGAARLFAGEIEAGIQDVVEAAGTTGAPLPALLLAGQVLGVVGRDREAGEFCANLQSRAAAEEKAWLVKAAWCLQALAPGDESTRSLYADLDDNLDEPALYWALGRSLQSRAPERARALFLAGLNLDSENPALWLPLAGGGGAGMPTLPQAMPHLERVLGRMQGASAEGRIEEAAEMARRLLEERPLLVPAARLLGREAEVAGNLWRAMEIYERLLDLLGGVPVLEVDLARVAQTAEAHDLAACVAARALEAGSEDPFLYYLLAAIESDRGNTDAAIDHARRAIELGSQDVRVWLKLGELYFEQMNISESIAAYQEAMAIEPSAAEAVRPFALATLTTDQYDSLRRVLETHITAYPENVSTLYSLGVMSLRDGDLEEAERYLERLAELAPDHRQVHYSLGQLYMRQGDRERGQAEMKRFAEIKAAEDEEWNHHNQAHFRRVEARKAVEEGDLQEAVALYEQSVADGTAQLSDFLELAEAGLKAGRPGRALESYESVLTTFPYHREALAGMAVAAAEAGDAQRRRDAESKLKILDWSCETESGSEEPRPET